MKQGFWNGEPVTYEVCDVFINECTDFEMPWTKPFVGQVRQAVKVITPGEEFFIDNEDGSGLHKLYNGGMMFDMHRSINNCSVQMKLPEKLWKTEFIQEKCDEIESVTNEYWKEHSPKAYERIQMLTKTLRSFENCDPVQLARHMANPKSLQKGYGICQVCGCTDDNACTHPEKENCHWVDADHTLCSHCLDKLKLRAAICDEIDEKSAELMLSDDFEDMNDFASWVIQRLGYE